MGYLNLFATFVRSRFAVVAAALFYGYAVHYGHVMYLNPVWEYYGFSYRALGAPEIMVMLTLLTIGAVMLPAVLTRPSSIILLLMFLMVYVPSIVITLGLDADRIERYGPSLALLSVGYSLACLVARWKHRQPVAAAPAPFGVPSANFLMYALAVWFVFCLVLIYEYHSIMRFVGLADIYDQRAAGANPGLFIGYVQTYFTLVLSPILVAAGLMSSRWWLVAVGTAGCLLLFMVNAQRTIILLPFVIMGLYYALKGRSGALRSTSLIVAGMGAGVMLSVSNYEEGVFSSFFALYFVFRTLGLPGLSFSQYFDLFSRDGFTWWSHVKGLSLLIPAPPSYANDEAWPNLGFIIGDRVYGSLENNANANLFAADGVAAAGALGVITIAIAFSVWLYCLDRASRGWNGTFTILVTLPLAVTLTNGQFFTMLLSFGGLFWTMVFYLYKPKAGLPLVPVGRARA